MALWTGYPVQQNMRNLGVPRLRSSQAIEQLRNYGKLIKKYYFALLESIHAVC